MRTTNYIKKINIDRLWQREWDGCTSIRLNKVEAVLGDCRLLGHLSRWEAVVRPRSYIGHTYVTHPYLIGIEDVPKCVVCDGDFTLGHILIECGNFMPVRQRYYDAENITPFPGNWCYRNI